MSKLLSQDYTQAKQLAVAEACRMRHHFMNSEHLLVGVLSVPKCDACLFLTKKGFNKRKMRSIISEDIGRGKSKCTQQVSPTLRTLGILKTAEILAQGYSKPTNTLHLLWAILLDTHCTATELLVEQGVDPEAWITEIEDRLVETTTRRPQLGAFNSSNSDDSQAKQWRERLSEASSRIRDKLVGHESAIKRVADTLTRSWAGLQGTGRPLASFLFVGPRGSGKQTLARNIAKFLYDDSERLLSLSLDEFSDENRAGLLLGSPEAGGGIGQEGILTTMALEYPFSVLYLEDVASAHSKAMAGLDQLLERGHVFDGKGQRVEFRDNVIILSLAIDPDFFDRESPVGFRLNSRANTGTQEHFERTLMPDLERVLRADTLGLVDEVVFFPPLGGREMNELLAAWTRELAHEVSAKHGITLTIDAEQVNPYLIAASEELGEGAGSLRRVFIREVYNGLAKALLEGRVNRRDLVTVGCQDNSLVFTSTKPVAERKKKRLGRVQRKSAASNAASNESAPGPASAPVDSSDKLPKNIE